MRKARNVAGNYLSTGKRVLWTILRIFLKVTLQKTSSEKASLQDQPSSASPLEHFILHNTGRSKKKSLMEYIGLHSLYSNRLKKKNRHNMISL